jgi:hypothetical protein
MMAGCVAIRTPCTVVYSARQDNAEGRTVPGPGLILKHSAVLIDDARSNRKAKAGPCLLSTEKRVEKTLLDFG